MTGHRGSPFRCMVPKMRCMAFSCNCDSVRRQWRVNGLLKKAVRSMKKFRCAVEQLAGEQIGKKVMGPNPRGQEHGGGDG